MVPFLLKKSDEMYRAMGVRQIEVTAAGTNGRYTWSQFGFDFASDADRVKMQEHFAIKLASSSKLSLMEALAETQKMTHSWEFAAFEHDGKRVGKDYMLDGPAWKGIRSLDPTSETYQRGAAYYGGK